MLLDRKRPHPLIMDRPLVGIELLRAHPEDSPGQFHQVRERSHEMTLASRVCAPPVGVELGEDQPGREISRGQYGTGSRSAVMIDSRWGDERLRTRRHEPCGLRQPRQIQAQR
jgi:hypothetical protein